MQEKDVLFDLWPSLIFHRQEIFDVAVKACS